MEEKKEFVGFTIPVSLKQAAVKEAARRGITLSALIKNYLSSFLPENIGISILERDGKIPAQTTPAQE